MRLAQVQTGDVAARRGTHSQRSASVRVAWLCRIDRGRPDGRCLHAWRVGTAPGTRGPGTRTDGPTSRGRPGGSFRGLPAAALQPAGEHRPAHRLREVTDQDSVQMLLLGIDPTIVPSWA